MSNDPQDQARRPLPPIETRFRPGESGNPGGRPKTGASISEALQILIRDGAMPNGKNRTRAWRIAARMLQDAEDGDPRAQVLVLERTEGRLPTPTPANVEEPTGVVFVPVQHMEREAWAALAQATMAARTPSTPPPLEAADLLRNGEGEG